MKFSPGLGDKSDLEYRGPVVDILPGWIEGFLFHGAGGPSAGVGDRKGRSTVGVIDGDMEAASLCALTVIIVAVVLIVGFEPLLEGLGSSG